MLDRCGVAQFAVETDVTSDAEARRTRQIVLTFVVGFGIVLTLVLLKVLL